MTQESQSSREVMRLYEWCKVPGDEGRCFADRVLAALRQCCALSHTLGAPDTHTSRSCAVDKDQRRLREIADWLMRYSDDGAYPNLPGPSSGQCMHAAQDLYKIAIRLMQSEIGHSPVGVPQPSAPAAAAGEVSAEPAAAVPSDKPHASLAGEAIELTISFLREMARRHPEVSQSSDVEAFIERELLPAMEMADNDRKSCGGLLTLLANEKRKVESLRSAELHGEPQNANSVVLDPNPTIAELEWLLSAPTGYLTSEADSLGKTRVTLGHKLMPSHVERRFQICKDHENAEWNQPTLDGDDCILCRLFYLEAQESLLEEWQQRALRAEGAIAEIQRPLDAQMARLNATVVRLNEENERLRSAPSATGSAEWAEDARPWEMRDGDVTFLWMDDGIEVVAMSHGKRWRTVLPLPVRRTESRIKEGERG